MPTTTRTTRSQLEALVPACRIEHGHHLDGVGPARYGWAAVTASGCVTYLGRGADAVDRAKVLGPLWGA